MIVPVIWSSFDFCPCKKKKIHPCKKILFEKGPWPHYSADLTWFWPRGSCWLCTFCHVAWHIILNFINYF